MRWIVGRSRRRQRGFGLIGMAAILVVLAASAGVMYLSSLSFRLQQSATDRAVALNWANSLLQTYALQHGRLPCAASEQLGAEDCQNGSARWLPAQTLLNGGMVSPSSVSAAMKQVTYQPHRGQATLSDPDLTKQPHEEYVPAVGQIVVASSALAAEEAVAVGASAVAIDGTQHGVNVPGPTPMANYIPAPGTLDFCQKLQNLALGPAGLNAVPSLPVGASGGVVASVGASVPINPWSAVATLVNAYVLATDGQTSSTSVNALSEAFQCEIVHASTDVLSTMASLSEPGGTVLGLQQGLLNGPAGWAAGDSVQPGQIGWGSFQWMTQILIPQIIGADWLFTGIRASQAYFTVAEEASNKYIESLALTPAILVGIVNPLWVTASIASDPFFSLAIVRRATDLAAQTAASVNDTTYEFQYQSLVNRLSTMQAWGAPSNWDPRYLLDLSTHPLSAADAVVQQAAQLGVAAALPVPTGP
ncbi:type II secretion system protein [Burkholderia cepacia]|uniref:type II secretion system protein n=1 Tax=Burkholderia cepacia TaxID=292 RepID=UPI00158CE382|nr:type II secretion system protein [Burkholderia cepacia]